MGTSSKLARSRFHLQEFSFTVKYRSFKKKIATDAMPRLHNKGEDDTGTPIDIEVHVSSIEDEVNWSTIDDCKVAIPEGDKETQPKPE